MTPWYSRCYTLPLIEADRSDYRLARAWLRYLPFGQAPESISTPSLLSIADNTVPSPYREDLFIVAKAHQAGKCRIYLE
jgi:hypothetical protein